MIGKFSWRIEAARAVARAACRSLRSSRFVRALPTEAGLYCPCTAVKYHGPSRSLEAGVVYGPANPFKLSVRPFSERRHCGVG